MRQQFNEAKRIAAVIREDLAQAVKSLEQGDVYPMNSLRSMVKSVLLAGLPIGYHKHQFLQDAGFTVKNASCEYAHLHMTTPSGREVYTHGRATIFRRGYHICQECADRMDRAEKRMDEAWRYASIRQYNTERATR